MKCITSPALDDTQIVSYVEGEADDAVVAHIKKCPFCSERANRWARLQNGLRKQFYRVDCPTPVELGDYHLGLLPASQALVLAQHLRECSLCRREVTELEDFLMEVGPEVDFLGAVKVLISRLINQTESSYTSADVILRGETKGPLTFEADGVVIVLDIQPNNQGKVNIFGQVAADDQEHWTGALVELRQGDELQFSTVIDDLGTFQYEGIMPGSQALRIISKDSALIIISNFEVSI